MSDVILVYPRTLWDIKNVTTRLPLAALYIGTVLQEHGFSVQIIDQRTDDDWQNTLRQALEKRPLWTGVSSMTGQQIRWGLDASQIVRDRDFLRADLLGGTAEKVVSLLAGKILQIPPGFI